MIFYGKRVREKLLVVRDEFGLSEDKLKAFLKFLGSRRYLVLNTWSSDGVGEGVRTTFSRIDTSPSFFDEVDSGAMVEMRRVDARVGSRTLYIMRETHSQPLLD